LAVRDNLAIKKECLPPSCIARFIGFYIKLKRAVE